MKMYSIVLDTSSLIPCGDKSERDKEAIRKFGDILCETNGITVYLSRHLVREYRSKLKRELEQHHPLPYFQASLIRNLNYLSEITTTRRGKLGKEIELKEVKLKLRILETSKIKEYDVKNVGLVDEGDKEVLRIALASTTTAQNTFLVTTDSQFFRDLNWKMLSQRYPNECQKMKIVKPSSSEFISAIIGCKSSESCFHRKENTVQ